MTERGERGKKKDEAKNPAFSGQGAGKPEKDRGRGLSEYSEFRSPDDGAACDRLGPITAAALLGSFFSLPKKNEHFVSPRTQCGVQTGVAGGIPLPGISGYRVGARNDSTTVSMSKSPCMSPRT